MSLNRRMNILQLGVALSLLCVTAWVHAQDVTSCAIAGTVTDSTGAVVPGVEVTVTNQATGLLETETTNSAGYYTAESLAPGDYSVSMKKTGFKNVVVRDIHLDPGQRRGEDVKLEVGEAAATVTVEAEAVAVQSESAELGGTVSEKEVANLMLNGRNFQTLALIVPGVSSASGANALPNYGEGGYLGQTEIVVGGTSIEKTTYSIDGLFDMDPNALINVNVLPAIDSISEVRILKDNYSARYGMAGSGQILVETKSGGNEFHGGGYEYVRNSYIGTAKPYTTPPTQGIAALHYNIFGYTLGGPLTIPHVYNSGRNRKTYFFAGGEWRINHYPAAIHTRNMIPQAMRNGDFSASPSDTITAAGSCPGGLAPCLVLTPGSANLLSNYRGLDPSTCIAADSAGRYDQLNTACMDPTAVALMKAYWPLPNDLGSSVNYINNGTEQDSENDYNYRIDHSINDRNLITGRWTTEEVNNLRPSRNYNDPAPNPGSTVYSRGMNTMVRWTATIKPTLINAMQGGETFNKWLLGVTNFTLPPGASIAQQYANADPFDRIPDISVNGGGTWAWLGVGAQPNFVHDGVGIVSDDLSWMKGSHLLQAGILYLFTIRHINASAFPMGNFSFTGANSGDSAADYMLGLDATYQQTNEQAQGRYHNRWFEAYVQDDWKLNPRLTLNLGLRWSYYRPTWQEGDQVTNFNASTWVASEAPAINIGGHETLNASNQPLTTSGTVASLTNGLVFAGLGGTPRGFDNPTKANFGPRVGFAYQLTPDGKTSLHGGFGVGYTQIALLETSSLLSNPPFVQSTTITNSLLSLPTAGGAAGAPGIPSLTVIGPDYRPTETKTFSLAVERQVLPNAVAQVAYAGSVSQHVLAEGNNYNFPLNEATSGTAGCAASTNNPLNSTASPYKGPPATTYGFDPCLNQGSTSSLYYEPYPGYGSISGTSNGGVANYNGLQSGLVWKAKDLTLNAAYTWSKAIEDVQPSNPGANGTGVGYDQSASFQNPRNKLADYGPPDFDRRQVFTSAWVYETPFFRHSDSLLVREALSGWSTSGLAVLESGLNVTPSLSVGNAGLATRPNQIAAVTHPGDGKTNLGHVSYFSAASFQAPAWGEFGDARPGDVRGPKEVAFNTALDKSFPIGERIAFKLRIEAFNVFNHPNTIVQGVWSGPTSSFGDVIGAGDPRQMEFAGRIVF
ncbi:MAG: carboxypeptidase regulatory-like domain-containing protein [Terracidiphilus sp.]